MSLLDSLGSDVRYAARALLRTPSFTAVALLTLAIGSGATTAVFSVVNSVLLEPLPYPNPEELVSIWHSAPGAPGLVDTSGELRVSPSMYVTYSEESRAFASIGLWNTGTASVTGFAEPEEVRVVAVTSGVLEALAVPPLLGRWLADEDQDANGPQRIMLSYEYWQRRFGGDRAAIGRTIDVGSVAREIVGVMPQAFRVGDEAVELIVPFRIDRSQLIPPPFCCQGVARLKPGMTLELANADVARMLPIWMDAWPFRDGGNGRAVYEDIWRITSALRPLKQDVVGNIGNVLWVMMGTIGVVLLIACANVTNLLLVRATGRQRELAVRAALGSGAWRIGRSLLIESGLLAFSSGAVGLFFADAALRALVAIGPSTLPRLDEISLDGRALVFALLVSLLSGLLVGLFPVATAARSSVSSALHGGGRGSSAGREQFRAQNALVVAQVALALVLLVSSGLMIRTFQALRSVEPGFTGGEQLQTLRVGIPASLVPEPERVLRMQNDIADALAVIPGVESAAFASAMPLDGFLSDWNMIQTENAPQDSAQAGGALRRFKQVSPGLFQTAGTPLIAGRDVTWNDAYDLRNVAVVSESLANELWGGASTALGKRIRATRDTPWREIVGVVADVRDNGLDQPAPPIVYWPALVANMYTGEPWYQRRTVTFVIRSPLAGTGPFLNQVEQAVWSVNPSLPVASLRTMQENYEGSLARQSFTLVMLGTAGAIALALGVVGLYGVLSYAVSQRRREIAIRLALGARQRNVTGSFVRQGVLLSTVGVALGLAAAVGVTRLMASLLFEVQPVDVPTYGAVALLLVVVAAIASYLPARRAATVDPAEALAAE